MKLNQYGTANGVTVGLVVTVIVLIASIVFGVWSFSGRQKYKNDTDQLISTAVSSAKQQQQSTDTKAFAIAEQKPLIQYVGPSAYGTISLFYPRTWSAYVNSTVSSGYPVDGYLYPSVLPTVTDSGAVNFALRIRVSDQTYTSVLSSVNSSEQAKLVTVTAYSLPKLPSVVGVEVVGQIFSGVTGTLVVLPLRNEALEVWTEGTAYLSEFNSDILPNLSFSP